MNFIYIEVDKVIELHDFALDKSGGQHGVLNLGLLESILMHIQNDDYYPTLEDKVTHVFFGINKGHAFNDGNKRASISATAYFLQVNGYNLLVDTFIREFENIAVHVANNVIDQNLLKKMITEFLNIGEFSESSKIQLMHNLSNQ